VAFVVACSGSSSVLLLFLVVMITNKMLIAYSFISEVAYSIFYSVTAQKWFSTIWIIINYLPNGN
jgi:hypothetical protein